MRILKLQSHPRRTKPSGPSVVGKFWGLFLMGWVVSLCLILNLSCSPGDEFKIVRAEKDEGRQIVGPLAKTNFSVIFTGSTRGEFEPCGCGGVYEGGFSRRSTVIETLRKVNPNLLLLDTGDVTSGGASSQTEFTAQAYHLLGYDAIALGEGDLRVGLDTFEKFSRQYSLPIVASNLKLKLKSPTCVREVISLQRGGRSIAVISVVSDQWLAIIPMEMRKQMVFERPEATLARLVPQLRPKYDLIILLSHLGPGNRKRVEGRLQGIDLWIDTGGHQWMAASQPSSPAKLPADGHLFPNQCPPLFISWQNDRKIGIAGLLLSLKNRKLTVPAAQMVDMVRGIKEDKRFLDIYDAYKYVSRQEMLTLLNKQLREAKTNTQPAAFEYVPSEKCGTCHQEIFRFWRTTPHGQAFATLKKANRDADLNCWSCHSTGFREETGFQNPVATPTLVDVGCQSCHMKELKTHPGKKKELEKIPPQMVQLEKRKDNLTQSWHCERCHVRHRSPNYEFKSYVKRIACPQALKKE
jgi:hypothetical protein